MVQYVSLPPCNTHLRIVWLAAFLDMRLGCIFFKCSSPKFMAEAAAKEFWFFDLRHSIVGNLTPDSMRHIRMRDVVKEGFVDRCCIKKEEWSVWKETAFGFLARNFDKKSKMRAQWWRVMLVLHRLNQVYLWRILLLIRLHLFPPQGIISSRRADRGAEGICYLAYYLVLTRYKAG